MTQDEYLKRYKANQKISGSGLEVTTHMPCPFCAAPDWLIFQVIDTEEEMKKGAVCEECGRGAKAEFQRTQGQINFELVQTCGNDIPEYLSPIRRVDG